MVWCFVDSVGWGIREVARWREVERAVERRDLAVVVVVEGVVEVGVGVVVWDGGGGCGGQVLMVPGVYGVKGLGEREAGEIGEGSYRPVVDRLGMLVITRRRFGGWSI